MNLIEHSISGEFQRVEAFDSEKYGPEWIDRGALPDGIPPDQAIWDGAAIVFDLDSAKVKLWGQVKAAREAHLAVIDTTSGPFDADDRARTNLLGKIQSFALLGEAAPSSVTWKLHDNSLVTLDRADFEALALTVLGKIEAVYGHSFALEAAIGAVADMGALDAIDIETGWPN